MTDVLTDGDEQNSMTEMLEKSKHPDCCPPKVSDGAVGWSCCDHLKKFIKSINLRANSELWGDKDSLTS